MTLPTKNQAIIGFIALLVTFALGRYSVNQTPKVEITKDTTKQEQKDRDKNTHTQTLVTSVKKADGTITVVTKTDTVISDDTKDAIATQMHFAETITPPKQSKISISILGAEDLSKGLNGPTYGLSVSKELLGPITVGAFGLRSGVIGVSIGLDF